MRGFQSGMRGHQSENLALMVTMRPLVKEKNDGSSANSQEISVSMENMCPDRNENQYVTSPSGEALGNNVNVRRSERIRNSPQRYNP